MLKTTVSLHGPGQKKEGFKRLTVSVSANPFCGRVNNDIGTVLDRPYQVTASTEGIVDDLKRLYQQSYIGHPRIC